LIDENWCAFFKRWESVLDVGVSCDGPERFHDEHRVNWSGQPTYAKVARGMEFLRKNGIKYKIIAVVTRQALLEPDAFYYYFVARRHELSGFHFNIVAESDLGKSDLRYTIEDRQLYHSFYRRLLELTHKSSGDGIRFEILNFTHGIERIMGSRPSASRAYFEEASAPLRTITLDTRGYVTTFHAGLGIEVLNNLYGDGLGFAMGNIMDASIEQMACSDKLQRMMRDFEVSARTCKASCECASVCPGGFETIKRQTLGTFDSGETTECVIHVKALTDALLADIGDYLNQTSRDAPAS
jgi:uncharacterized protein